MASVLLAALVVFDTPVGSAIGPSVSLGSGSSSDMGVLSGSAVERVAGADRYSTSVAVAARVGGGSVVGLDRLIVVSGESFPDGLAASGLAGFLDRGGRSGRTAVVLSRRQALPEVVRDAIAASGVPASQIVVVGGAAAVSDVVQAAVAAAAGWDGAGANPVVRIGGEDRYGTAAAIVDYVTAAAGGSLPESYRTVLVASGAQFPDALAAGALAYRNGHLLVLSPRAGAPQVTLDAVAQLNANCALLVGGAAALASAVESGVGTAVTGAAGCGVERVAGRDRYETAVKVAERFVIVNGVSQPILASGTGFADSLTAAPLAGGNRPLLLTAPGQLSTATGFWLSHRRTEVRGLLVIGGTSAVSSTVGNQSNEKLNPPQLPPSWATQAGSIGDAEGFGVSVWPDGSSIVTGAFRSSASFGTRTLSSRGERDVFVGKLSVAGEWVWATRAGGVGDDVASDVSVLADGSAIVTGSFQGSASFGATTLTSAGSYDVFVAKIDANGRWLWAIAAGGAGGDSSVALSVLPDGSAYLTGWFLEDAIFGATTLRNIGDQDLFVAKVDADGRWVWATAAGGPHQVVGAGVAALPDGSAIITGSYSHIAFVGSTTLMKGLGTWLLTAKIDADGNWVWATATGAVDYTTLGRDVSALPDGSAIVTGYISDGVQFGSTVLRTSGGIRPFVARVSADGEWVWAVAAGGSGNSSAYSVAVLADGSAIITGNVKGVATFGDTSLTSRTGTAYGDILIAKVSAVGEWVWANMASTSGDDGGRGVAVFHDGSALITGYFQGTATFGSKTLTAYMDAFVVKVDASGSFG